MTDGEQPDEIAQPAPEPAPVRWIVAVHFDELGRAVARVENFENRLDPMPDGWTWAEWDPAWTSLADVPQPNAPPVDEDLVEQMRRVLFGLPPL